ncbi:hypothetical protein QAD02_021245 [Eretmocerus hayati]|uniref:Uncharacterized protein n=1 Tax=Eretmocerus hayati TaxID=131215 RepID=A0ACC2PSX4_9HYME|nr:hypothetical protein QAD02_021245 [Eretmocerus hayati]
MVGYQGQGPKIPQKLLTIPGASVSIKSERHQPNFRVHTPGFQKRTGIKAFSKRHTGAKIINKSSKRHEGPKNRHQRSLKTPHWAQSLHKLFQTPQEAQNHHQKSFNTPSWAQDHRHLDGTSRSSSRKSLKTSPWAQNHLTAHRDHRRENLSKRHHGPKIIVV